MYIHQQTGRRWREYFDSRNNLALETARYTTPYQSTDEVARISTMMNAQPGQEAFAFDHAEHPDPEKTAPFAVALLALSEIEGLGRKSLMALVKAYGEDLGQVWKESQSRVYEILSEARIPTAKDVAKAILADPNTAMSNGKAQYLALAERRVYVLGPSDMPAPLQQIPDPPLWLFVQGMVEALFEDPFVAVVGTRKPTDRGRVAADIVARQLAAYPITLVSGLAEGIDEHAHSASLRENVVNVAFLGHGVNFSIPASTKKLREKIVQQGGAVVTEYLPGEHFQKSYFVQRNRLQAALANVVIPVEANPKGGTAHTINFARKFNRKVVGIEWPGANGVLKELREEGRLIVDIFDPAGRKILDKVFRDLAEGAGHETYALTLAERRLLSEMQSRDVSAADVEQLVVALRKSLERRH